MIAYRCRCQFKRIVTIIIIIIIGYIIIIIILWNAVEWDEIELIIIRISRDFKVCANNNNPVWTPDAPEFGKYFWASIVQKGSFANIDKLNSEIHRQIHLLLCKHITIAFLFVLYFLPKVNHSSYLVSFSVM